jgi:uncharacterized coiled-coil protein SlyX
VTLRDEPALSRTEPEFRARQLGSALRGLAAELVDERRTVAELRREIAELKSRLKSLQPARDDDDAEDRAGGRGRPGQRAVGDSV